jgi:hypothetical protein
VLQEFELEKLTVREREVGCSHLVREFEFGFLTVRNSYGNGQVNFVFRCNYMSVDFVVSMFRDKIGQRP